MVAAISSRPSMPWSPQPLTRAALLDPPGLRSVLETQASEANAFRERLLRAQRECARLQQRLHDCESELSVAAQATATATERLGAHAVRDGLVLAASVERWGAERAAVEDELRRMERLLWERDQEIAQLRRTARDLEASQLQGDLELRGLAVARENADVEARALGLSISELLAQQGSSVNASPKGPSPAVLAMAEEAERRLNSKRAEHASLKGRAEAIAEEARRLEAEEGAAVQQVLEYDQALRARRRQLEAEDQRLTREGELLREHGQELRRALEREQRDAVGIGQRAALELHTTAEAESVKREVTEIMATLPRLAARLYMGGRHVYSLMVPGDRVDECLHAHLRGCGPRGDPAPALVCRLGPREYVIDGVRVVLTEANAQITVREAGGATAPLRDFIRRRAPPAPAPLRSGGAPAQAPQAAGSVPPQARQQAQQPPPPGVPAEAVVF